MIRGPVVTRKNAGGSRNEDAARLAATIWTVTATAGMAGLNVLTWLTAYLDACGRNGGKPPTGPGLQRFLRDRRIGVDRPDGERHGHLPPRPGLIFPVGRTSAAIRSIVPGPHSRSSSCSAAPSRA